MKFFTENDFQKLLTLVKENGIEWGNINHFLPNEKLKLESYHPDYRDNILEFVGKHSANCAPMMYQIGSHIQHDHLLTDKQAEIFQKVIDKDFKSKRAQDLMKSCFNSVTYEIVVYSKDFMKTNMRSEWWKVYTVPLWILPLSATESQLEELLLKVKEEIEVIRERLTKNNIEIDAIHYRKKYLDLTFNPFHHDSEVEDLMIEAKKQGLGDLSKFTIIRMKRLLEPGQNMKPFQFKSTGRKILLEMSRYGTVYSEVDPIL